MRKLQATSMLTAIIAVGMAVLVAGGCNLQFRRFAQRADKVGVAVAVRAVPKVVLEVEDPMEPMGPVESMARLATGMMTTAVAVRLERRLRRVMGRHEIESIVLEGFQRALSSGSPFEFVPDSEFRRVDGTIFVDLVDYGVVRTLEGPLFVVEYRVHVYESRNNDRVYRDAVTCRNRGFFVDGMRQQWVSSAALVTYFQTMDDATLRDRMERVFSACTSKMVSKIRDAAG